MYKLIFVLCLATSCAHAETYMQTSVMEDGKDKVRSQLLDGDSAEFRSVYYSQKVLPVACGEVNAKNAFGAYAGYKLFIASGRMALLEDGSRAFVKLWNEMCK